MARDRLAQARLLNSAGRFAFEEKTMALPHARSGQIIDIRPLGSRLRSTVSTALFKAEDLEVLRLVLLSGKGIPPHRVSGEVTIQCIEGVVEVSSSESCTLEAGQMLYLRGDEAHSLRALEDASVLLTIFLDRRDGKLQGGVVA
jgi:quercetin dioxygenase-like cupin family protein